jgi:hypothetical protein
MFGLLKVRYLLVLVACLLLASWLSGCGYVAVSGAILTNQQSVNGLVSIVQFNYVNGAASVTIVTLASSDMANTFHFCGDQRAQFPLDTVVRASFSPGSSCDHLISVSWQ